MTQAISGATPDTVPRLAPGPVSRRHVLCGGVGLMLACGRSRADTPTPAAPPALPTDGRIAFNVFRHGSQIGTHTLTFTAEPGGFSVQIAVALRVGLGPLTLFRYQIAAMERWRDGQFTELTSTTDHNGTRHEARAHVTNGTLLIEGTGVAPYVAPPGTLPLTHWNRAQMQAPLFNPETGRMSHERATDMGPAPVPLPGSGTAATGQHYALTGDARIDDWYDGESWIGLSAVAKDGSTILYQRI